MEKKLLFAKVIEWQNKSYFNKQITEKDFKIRTIKVPIYSDKGFEVSFDANIFERNLEAETSAKKEAEFHRKKARSLHKKADLYKDFSKSAEKDITKVDQNIRSIYKSYTGTGVNVAKTSTYQKASLHKKLNEIDRSKYYSASMSSKFDARQEEYKAANLENKQFLEFRKSIKETIKIPNPAHKDLSRERYSVHFEEEVSDLGTEKQILFSYRLQKRMAKKNLSIHDLLKNSSKELGEKFFLKDFVDEIDNRSIKDAYIPSFENEISEVVNYEMQKYFKNFSGRYEITNIKIDCKIEKKYFNIYEIKWGTPDPLFSFFGGISYWYNDEFLIGKRQKAIFRLATHFLLTFFSLGWWLPIPIYLYIKHRIKLNKKK